jgi:hypothetical protein
VLVNKALAKRNPEYAMVRTIVLGMKALGIKVGMKVGVKVLAQCNMALTYA